MSIGRLVPVSPIRSFAQGVASVLCILPPRNMPIPHVVERSSDHDGAVGLAFEQASARLIEAYESEVAAIEAKGSGESSGDAV